MPETAPSRRAEAPARCRPWPVLTPHSGCPARFPSPLPPGRPVPWRRTAPARPSPSSAASAASAPRTDHCTSARTAPLPPRCGWSPWRRRPALRRWRNCPSGSSSGCPWCPPETGHSRRHCRLPPAKPSPSDPCSPRRRRRRPGQRRRSETPPAAAGCPECRCCPPPAEWPPPRCLPDLRRSAQTGCSPR